jgi:biotin-dependent carboxylase-like uncharacterized protein
MAGSLRVLRAMAPLLLQDRGRPGLAALGVPASGAFDTTAAALAQRLVGNSADQPSLEITMGSVVLQTDRTVTAAVSGAEVAISVAGAAVAVNEVFPWPAGTELVLGMPSQGVRNYLAVHGGFACDSVLGSASRDVLSELGPAPLAVGDVVGLAGRPAAAPRLSHAPVAPPAPGVLHVVLGPRDDWFAPAALAALLQQQFAVTEASNRVGVRLSGPRLHRTRTGELSSEPLQRGAVQVPPSGQPIIMGPDHPTTGGYPVIATVAADDWSLCAQLRPGDVVRFVLLPS